MRRHPFSLSLTRLLRQGVAPGHLELDATHAPPPSISLHALTPNPSTYNPLPSGKGVPARVYGHVQQLSHGHNGGLRSRSTHPISTCRGHIHTPTQHLMNQETYQHSAPPHREMGRGGWAKKKRQRRSP